MTNGPDNRLSGRQRNSGSALSSAADKSGARPGSGKGPVIDNLVRVDIHLDHFLVLCMLLSKGLAVRTNDCDEPYIPGIDFGLHIES